MAMQDMSVMRKEPIAVQSASPSKAGRRKEYPYGLNIDLDGEQVERLPGLKNAKVGSTVRMICDARVKGIRMNDEMGRGKKTRMDLCIERMDVSNNAKDEFKHGFDEK